jgi:putative oxidoreductase
MVSDSLRPRHMTHLNSGCSVQTARFVEASVRNAGPLDTGLLIARLVFGLILSAHGAQKLFGWFGGDSLTATGGFFELLSFRPGRVFAGIASGTEIVAGLLITFGFLGPWVRP